MLHPGLHPVAQGCLAAVVTSLEMLAPPGSLRRPVPMSDGPALRLARWKAPATDKYRALFRRVGAPWLWQSRLALDDAKLGAILEDREDEVYAVLDPRGIEVGLVELDFRAAGECEIAFFGLIPALAGRGLGRGLMHQALQLAWRPAVERVWVHTCTLDHPGALGFYIRQGFVPFARAVEVLPDPRIEGLLEEGDGREPLLP